MLLLLLQFHFYHAVAIFTYNVFLVPIFRGFFYFRRVYVHCTLDNNCNLFLINYCSLFYYDLFDICSVARIMAPFSPLQVQIFTSRTKLTTLLLLLLLLNDITISGTWQGEFKCQFGKFESALVVHSLVPYVVRENCLLLHHLMLMSYFLLIIYRYVIREQIINSSFLDELVGSEVGTIVQ